MFLPPTRQSMAIMRACCGLTLIGVMLLPATAMANLRIDDARFYEGDLIVRGATSGPSQTVTLDGRFTTTSGEDGQFSFQLRHTPFLCTVKLVAGTDSQSAKVADCMMNDRRMPDPAPGRR
jgi:hypothetical protein